MPTIHGNTGVIRIGANAIAEVQSFDYDQDSEVVDDSSMGDADLTFVAGRKSARCSGQAWNDDGDTLGQATLVPGAAVAMELYPEGTAGGQEKITFSGVVRRWAKRVRKDGINEFNFEVQGTGAVTDTTV